MFKIGQIVTPTEAIEFFPESGKHALLPGDELIVVDRTYRDGRMHIKYWRLACEFLDGRPVDYVFQPSELKEINT